MPVISNGTCKPSCKHGICMFAWGFNIFQSHFIKYSVLLAQEWLVRDIALMELKLPLMHGNGCQQAFSCGTTISAVSLQPLGGWRSIAPNRTAVKCLTYEVGCTYPFPKYQRLPLIVNSWCTLRIQVPSSSVGSDKSVAVDQQTTATVQFLDKKRSFGPH